MAKANRARKSRTSRAGKIPSKGGNSHPGFKSVQGSIAKKRGS